MGYIVVLDTPVAILIGAVLGLLGAVPLLYVLCRALKAKRTNTDVPSIPVGFAAVVISGLIVTIEIYLAYIYAPNNLIEISTSAVLVMLAATLAAGLVVWHKMMNK